MIALTLALGLTIATALVLSLALFRAVQRERKLERAMERANSDLEHLERAFTRFAPEDVVERLGQGATEIAPERREVTVMFADLVGFTGLSERVDPGVLVPVLNDYFSRMSSIIREHHGHVSRIMGDGLMALFGALEGNTWQTADAVRAALAMRAELQALNRDLEARALPPLAFGVGVHRGEVLTAVLGSREMMEFTVMGDVVNIAARVEGLTRQHQVDILVTDEVRERLDERFGLRELPAVPVKGKSEPIRTWTVVDFQGA
ncbi:MAG TPA: adenylate/guanylate cyclase domain-containing protein [Polyangia bacterium]|jgi:adenylate cyclase|nr:adenylate/guanylate cyclase domain-containing protein [Polyangia bacterium]